MGLAELIHLKKEEQDPHLLELQRCVVEQDLEKFGAAAAIMLMTGTAGVKKVIQGAITLGDPEVLGFAQSHLMRYPDEEQNQQKYACVSNLIERLRDGHQRFEEHYDIDALIIKQREWETNRLGASPVAGRTDRNHAA